jgi:hypothetical protein
MNGGGKLHEQPRKQDKTNKTNVNAGETLRILSSGAICNSRRTLSMTDETGLYGLTGKF